MSGAVKTLNNLLNAIDRERYETGGRIIDPTEEDAIREMLAYNQRLEAEAKDNEAAHFELGGEARDLRLDNERLRARIDAALEAAEDVNAPDDYRKVGRIIKALRGESE